MDKQKALDKIANFYRATLGGEYDDWTGQYMHEEEINLADIFPKEFNMLQELVDRDVLQEVDMYLITPQFNFIQYECPICGKLTTIDCSAPEDKNRDIFFCGYCGQRLEDRKIDCE